MRNRLRTHLFSCAAATASALSVAAYGLATDGAPQPAAETTPVATAPAAPTPLPEPPPAEPLAVPGEPHSSAPDGGSSAPERQQSPVSPPVAPGPAPSDRQTPAAPADQQPSEQWEQRQIDRERAALGGGPDADGFEETPQDEGVPETTIEEETLDVMVPVDADRKRRPTGERREAPDGDRLVTRTVAAASAPVPAAPASLPMTGFDALLPALLGGALLSAGLGLTVLIAPRTRRELL